MTDEDSETTSLSEPTVENFDFLRNKPYDYTSHSHQNTLLSNLGLYGENGLFSDVKVIVNGTEYLCHRIILGASSPYFRAVFQHQVDHEILTIDEISSHGFEALRRYMYSGKITICEENLEDIFAAADFLQFRDLVEICATKLMQHLRAQNCLRVMHLADCHSCYDLYHEAEKYALSHFHSVIWTEDFTNLPVRSLLSLLQHEYCNVDSELDILVALCRWINAQNEINASELDRHLGSCNLNLVEDNDVIMCLENYPVLEKSTLIKDRLKRVNPCHARILERVVQKRKKEVVVVIVRKAVTNEQVWPAPRQVVTQLIFYDPYESEWIVLTELPGEDREMFGASVLRNNVYITGGSMIETEGTMGPVTNQVWLYHTLLDSWTETCPMLKRRKHHGSSVLNDKMYVIGGSGGLNNRRHRDGEVYDPVTDQWTLLPDLLHIGGIVNPSVFPLNGQILVIGGLSEDINQDGWGVKMYEDPVAQSFDPKNSKWRNLDELTSQMKSLNLKPSFSECLPYLGFIIFVGDDRRSFEEKKMQSLKLYDPVSGEIQDVLRYSHNRFGGYTMYRDEIVLTGGVRGSSARDFAYSCDLSRESPEWEMWTRLPCESTHHPCFTLFLGIWPRDGQPY